MRRAVLAIVPALFVLGCAESDQNPFIVRVTNINLGAALLADVISWDEQQMTFFIPTDVTPVEFSNRPYSGSVVVDPSNFTLDFQITGYTVRWRATQGTPAGLDLAPFTHTEAASLVVPINDTAVLGALVVPLGMKSAAPFANLAVTGGEIPLIADVDIVGHPAVDPGDQIHVHASLSVVFADYADE